MKTFAIKFTLLFLASLALLAIVPVSNPTTGYFSYAAAPQITPNTFCKDSDAGTIQPQYVRGTVTTAQEMLTDYCQADRTTDRVAKIILRNKLTEYSCLQNSPPYLTRTQTTPRAVATTVTCPNGCSKGACIKPQVKPQSEQLEIAITNLTFNIQGSKQYVTAFSLSTSQSKIIIENTTEVKQIYFVLSNLTKTSDTYLGAVVYYNTATREWRNFSMPLTQQGDRYGPADKYTNQYNFTSTIPGKGIYYVTLNKTSARLDVASIELSVRRSKRNFAVLGQVTIWDGFNSATNKGGNWEAWFEDNPYFGGGVLPGLYRLDIFYHYYNDTSGPRFGFTDPTYSTKTENTLYKSSKFISPAGVEIKNSTEFNVTLTEVSNPTYFGFSCIETDLSNDNYVEGYAGIRNANGEIYSNWTDECQRWDVNSATIFETFCSATGYPDAISNRCETNRCINNSITSGRLPLPGGTTCAR